MFTIFKTARQLICSNKLIMGCAERAMLWQNKIAAVIKKHPSSFQLYCNKHHWFTKVYNPIPNALPSVYISQMMLI